VTIFYEGGQVRWAASEVDAVGHIVSLGSTAAHVKWQTGPSVDQITFTDLFDIEPVTASKVDDDPMHLVAVRRAYDHDQEVGVLNFLATNDYLGSWSNIARDVLAYAEDRIRADASMELVDEQLTVPEREAVVKASAMALLRDAFGIEEE